MNYKRPPHDFNGKNCPVCGNEEFKTIEKEIENKEKEITLHCNKCNAQITYIVNSNNEKISPYIIGVSK